MSLLVYKFSDYEHTAEREQYRELCKQLRDFYGRLCGVYLFLANYNINDCELDGLLIKPDGIIVMEFKNYGGYVIATDNGDWIANGTPVKGGSSRKTVYQQVRLNRIAARNGLQERALNSKQVKDMSALVVFHRSIRLSNKLPQRTQSWLHICDEDNFLEKTRDICSQNTDLPHDTMLRLIDQLGLSREYLDEEYSDMSLLPPLQVPTLGSTSAATQLSSTPTSESLPASQTTQHTAQTTAATPQQSTTPETADTPVTPAPLVLVTEGPLCSATLPQWLDTCIYGQMHATYRPVLTNMTVIDWEQSDLLNYLGTYFPRSYAEAYCLFSRFFHAHPEWQERTHLSVFDFCCGTGGDVLGLLAAIEDRLPNVKDVSLKLHDGNNAALHLCEQILEEYKAHARCPQINWSVSCCEIQDKDDLQCLASIQEEPYDIVLTFKALNEIISKGCMGEENVYDLFAHQMLPLLKTGGLMLIADVSTQNEAAKAWIPKLMEHGLSALRKEYHVGHNRGFNEAFYISHSHRKEEVSKITWSIITHT